MTPCRKPKLHADVHKDSKLRTLARHVVKLPARVEGMFQSVRTINYGYTSMLLNNHWKEHVVRLHPSRITKKYCSGIQKQLIGLWFPDYCSRMFTNLPDIKQREIFFTVCHMTLRISALFMCSRFEAPVGKSRRCDDAVPRRFGSSEPQTWMDATELGVHDVSCLDHAFKNK